MIHAEHLCVLKNMLLFHKASDNELGQLKFKGCTK